MCSFGENKAEIKLDLILWDVDSLYGINSPTCSENYVRHLQSVQTDTGAQEALYPIGTGEEARRKGVQPALAF
jgi:hypothetical protein